MHNVNSLLCLLPLLTCSPSYILIKHWMKFHAAAAASADSQIFTINTQSAEMLVASLWIEIIGRLIFSLPSCLSRLSSSERYQSCCFSEEKGEHKGTNSTPCCVLWSVHLFRLNGACNTYHCSGSRTRCCFVARGNYFVLRSIVPCSIQAQMVRNLAELQFCLSISLQSNPLPCCFHSWVKHGLLILQCWNCLHLFGELDTAEVLLLSWCLVFVRDPSGDEEKKKRACSLLRERAFASRIGHQTGYEQLYILLI